MDKEKVFTLYGALALSIVHRQVLAALLEVHPQRDRLRGLLAPLQQAVEEALQFYPVSEHEIEIAGQEARFLLGCLEAPKK